LQSHTKDGIVNREAFASIQNLESASYYLDE
jgi:hypothetical protein